MNDMHAPDPADAGQEEPLDPRRALDIATQTRSSYELREKRAGLRTALLWSIVWLLGYGVMTLAAHTALLAQGPATIIFTVCMAAGLILTFLIQIRASRGVRGPAARQGQLYGLAWFLVMIVVFALSGPLGAHLGDAGTAGWLINAVATFGVGIMIMLGGIIFFDRAMTAFGVGILLAVALSLLAGPGLYTVVFMLAAAIALIVSLIGFARHRRAGAPR